MHYFTGTRRFDMLIYIDAETFPVNVFIQNDQKIGFGNGSNAGGSASTTTVGGTPTATAGNIPMTSLRPPSGTTASPFGIGGGGLIPPGTTDTDESGAYYRKTSVSIALLVVMVLLFI
ncbi:hypothetical protein EUTSA_v10027017mg [Eutrema salsugineum]|uniref:Uncharacterized protein n=1 Tax=Eutrema salsugineum TaxID=72664 RepID=V4MLB2_EUTSA|nr:hypothetical protein EUTSA_v10027017mg [Eutrema salsugineum]